jgi:predicted RNA-binding protein (virulence factor B family)
MIERKVEYEEGLSNEQLTVKELEEVDLEIIRPTDIGYLVSINGRHQGILHYNEVFIELWSGEKMRGFIKAIREGNKIDVVLGRAGFAKVEDEARKIISLLEKNNGKLPFHDKSGAEEIYEFFGMSKKTFKMTIGNLYKQRVITISPDGISLVKKS